jgi:hypothetical protein
MMRDYLQTEALIRESGVPALIFRNALYLDTPPVSLGGPAVFTADHPGREVTDAAPDLARLLQHRVDHLERHLPRQLAQVTRREPSSGRRRRVRRGAEPGGGRGAPPSTPRSLHSSWAPAAAPVGSARSPPENATGSPDG